MDGSVVIDMSNFKQISIDPTTFIATIGPGNRLGDVALSLNNEGRALPHGTCPYVGIGGHSGKQLINLKFNSFLFSWRLWRVWIHVAEVGFDFRHDSRFGGCFGEWHDCECFSDQLPWSLLGEYISPWNSKKFNEILWLGIAWCFWFFWYRYIYSGRNFCCPRFRHHIFIFLGS